MAAPQATPSASPEATQGPATAQPGTSAGPTRRWLRAAAWTAAGIAALAVGGAGAAWWWAGTEGSLATALGWAARVQALQPLTVGKASGALRTGGQVDTLEWKQDGLLVTVRDASLAWDAWALLHGTLRLERLSAGSVQVTDQRAPSGAPSAPPKALRLPLRVVLEEFSIGQFDLAGKANFAASGIAGRYAFNGLQHRLDLKSAQVASGQYSGRATLTASGPLTLDAALSGALSVAVPNNPTPVPLALQATASGVLTELQLKAELQMTAPPPASSGQPAQQPQASASARVLPWAAQPLPQAEARFHDLDIAALLPNLPQTLLTGSASVHPLDSGPAAPAAWDVLLQLDNALPGPWDAQRLPLERLDAQGEWRSGVALVRSLKAQLGGGELLASGQWASAAPGNPPDARAAQPWEINATLSQVNPALLHSRLAPLPLDGRADVSGQGAALRFDANVQAAAGRVVKNRDAGRPTPQNAAKRQQAQLLQQLRLRDAVASGSWNPQQDGGTLELSALRLRTDDAELSGQLQVQPAAKGGQGRLALRAPGLEVRFNGELRQNRGGGELRLQGSDAAQALRWLQKIPGMPAALLHASASGSAALQAQWQGGWQDPVLQARLETPSLDWTMASSKAPEPAAPAISRNATLGAAPNAAPSPDLLKIRDLQATLSGRLSQAQLDAQGRVEIGQRRYGLLLAAEGGQKRPAGAVPLALGASAWQGLLRQLSLRVEDPALGNGAWQLATTSPVPLQWTPSGAGGAFESGAGQALLTAPTGSATSAAPQQARLAWQPVRWRDGELITAGSLTGLPLSWLELVAGPQLAGAGLGGSLVFDGQWDAVLGDSLKLKASLARSSGDLTVQAEGVQGNTARVAAGVKEARISLETAGNALSLALRWDSERAGTASGQLRTQLARAPGAQGLGGWRWPDDALLSGQLRAQLPRIGVWSLLAPPGWRLRGALGADIAISGNRAAPSLSGDLQANDLALRSVVDGIEFGRGRLRARLDGTRLRIQEFTLQGAGEQGAGGSLTAQGEAGWINGQPQVQLTARLQRLRASIRTDRQVTLSGDVQAILQGQQTELTGKLVIDQARIALPDEGTPQLGDDVVVRSASGAATGQKAPEKAMNATPEKAARPLRLAMQIDLGSDFRIQGKGIDTRIRGTLALEGSSLADPRLIGTVRTVGGQYRAYGQRLDVEQGVIRFTGALNNPTLDILAIRPNLTQRVGVQITGTALLPSVRLYAQPELADAEKLSWLVVGRASAAGGAEAALLQQAALALLGSKGGGMSGGLAASLGLDELSYRGASTSADGTAAGGAITLGKRFSRNFYAAYERSISGALGTLLVFYDLSQRFTLRAQAGQQSAVDLIFTVPYD